jgi:hypothetical protein
MTDEQILSEYSYITGYCTALSDNDLPACFPILLARHLEKIFEGEMEQKLSEEEK